MAFVLPVFNTSADVWHTPDAPPGPRTFNTVCQLYINPKGAFDITPTVLTEWAPPVYLRVPMGTPLEVGDICEVPPASGWLYGVRWTDRVHLGFPNEYFVAIVEQLAGTPPPPAAGAILLEGGDFILTEVGDHILLE